MLRKILIANRGEIAVRVIRACRDLNISPIAVYSEVDRESLHVKLADEAYCLGAAPPSDSYLVIEKIIDAARKSGAEAIHPGYGFLAENEEFAQACEDSSLIFIGPSAASIQLMGSKIASRTAVQKAGIPVVPGTEGALHSVEEAVNRAAQIGYPVMVKASAGGGGKGLRLVHNASELRSDYRSAQSEAQSSFGDPTLFIEKYLENPRHIEVQVLGDRYGHLIFLGERECSIQRRHQKVVEECPSPAVNDEFRAILGQAALSVARAADYYNAGTVEFLVDSSAGPGAKNFYFLEMNTRVQVEHPVTEMVTGVDLVREQILIAEGRSLSYRQEEIQLKGVAIECRVYAEDPQNNFFPSPGTIEHLFEPSGPGIRSDSGAYAGFTIPIHYDPLISKLVAHGETREQAICRMRRALCEYKIVGVKTTLSFFEVLLSHPEFVRGNLHTGFIEEHCLIEQMTRGVSQIGETPLIAAVLHSFFQDESPSETPHIQRSRWKEYGRFPAHLSRRWAR